jgi:Ca-activated chloride channel homolog
MNTIQANFTAGTVFLWLLALFMLIVACVAHAEVDLSAAMGHSCALAGAKHTGYFRVALKSHNPTTAKERAPLNVALVLDHSGSMAGAKLENTKAAAIKIIEQLKPDDIVAVVAYDTNVTVLMPSTKIGNREGICAAIRSLQPGSDTALYNGTMQGAAEVRKFKSDRYVNRVVLLSDGLANVGPCSTESLAGLGTALRQENISVTTIGLGLDFNEDLMSALASKSDGNHMFAEMPSDVLKAFKDEFMDAMSVVAKSVSIKINFDSHVHPIRGMGREVSINGQNVYAGLVQLYTNQTKYVLVEVEIDPMPANERIQAGTARIEYVDPLKGDVKNLQAATSLSFTESPETVQASENKDVMACVVAQLATEENERAVALRDRGRVEQSRQALQKNAQWLQEQGTKYNSKQLNDLGKANLDQAGKIADEDKWRGLRKSMGKGQYDIKQQTSK